MAVVQRPAEIRPGEIFGAAAGVKVAKAHVHSVGAALHGGDDGLVVAGKQLHHAFSSRRRWSLKTSRFSSEASALARLASSK